MLCRGCPWDYSAAGDELPARRRDRGQHRPAEDRRGAEPVHRRPRSTSTSRRSPRGAPRRGARRQRLPQRGPHDQRDPVAGRRSARPSSTRSSSPSAGIRCAVKAGHTYAKIGGASGPDLRFTGRVPGARKRAIFGDAARGRSLKLKARSDRRRRAAAAARRQRDRDGLGLDRPHRDRVRPLRPAASSAARSPRPSARRSGSARPSAAGSPSAAAEQRAEPLRASRGGRAAPR